MGGQYNGQYYIYLPSVAAAAIFVVLFAATSLAHIVQMFRYGSYFFTPFIIGCLMETIGYIGRLWLHHDPTSLAPFILQDLLLILAPILLAATLYMSFARIVRYLQADHLSLMRSKRLAAVFVTADIICFITQAGGSSMLTSTNQSTIKTGRAIALVGLVLQIVIFGFFIVMVCVFKKRASTVAMAVSVPFNKYLVVLLIASAFIVIRNVVRVVEFVEGYSGYVWNHEAFLYIFDALPMFLVTVTILVHHAGRFVRDARRKTANSGHEMTPDSERQGFNSLKG